MSTLNTASWVCLLLPLGSTVLITAADQRISRRLAAFVSTLTTMGAFAAAVVVFVKLHGEGTFSRSHETTSWTWLSAGTYHFGLTLLNDPLSVMMMLIVTGVGSLIVAYSVGYMEGEDEERRFFAYMSLFVFSMLLLVQSGTLLLLLAGWGMVGLSSYLLIGYHQDRPEAVAAAKKAFVMNAFGDATMALSLFLLIQHTGALDYTTVFHLAPTGGTIATLIALGLLGGAVAKSAQIPLHTWLPDAMEGPTPVSALIHAATMVTAGVYLIVRCHPLFEDAKAVENIAAGIGAATLVMAGLIALVQTDIKRVIAYSTMSQIGYMFVGAASGAYATGMFHLMTHAFFKALLFLSAGLLIHSLTGEQDIRKMGGMGKVMPHTRTVFLIGSLALVGIPPFAGFFSKDSIIAATLERGGFGYVLFAACIFGAFLTGVYAFRLYFIVFTGEQSSFAQEHFHEHDGKEGPFSMVWTVSVLAILSTVGGFLQFTPVWHPLSDWLAQAATPFTVATNRDEYVASACAIVAGLAGIGLAWLLYSAKSLAVPKASPILEHKFYWDELYDAIFYRPAVWLARALTRFVERALIGGSIGEVTRSFGLGSRELGRAQNGLVRSYALALAIGLTILIIVFLSGEMSLSVTTIEIFLPILGALVVWLVPMPRTWIGAFATLVAILEVYIWISTLGRFNFGDSSLQLSQQTSWFSDLHVSYHVGQYAFSVWLIGLTTVVTAACIAYGWWVGRERARAYFGLMLFLLGAVVGVFAAQDLILFYAFFEAMLIPLYVLVGVWGGPGRLGATLKFVVYTVAGSVLMLASIVVYGLQQGTFDMTKMSGSSNDWIFLGFAVAFAVKAPLFPFHGWLPDAYREAPPEVAALLSGVISKVAMYGFLRIAIAKFPGPTQDFRVPILVLASIGLVYGSLVAFRAPDIRGVIAYSSLAQMGLITLGLFAGNDLGSDGAVLQMVNHGLISAALFLLAGMIERRASTGELALLGGFARGRPALATALMTTGVIALAVPLSSAFAGEFLILAGVFQQGWAWVVIGAGSIVLGAMYVLRLISAVLHGKVGSAVSEAAMDLRDAELGMVVPLIACLLVLSASPSLISGHAFGGNLAFASAEAPSTNWEPGIGIPCDAAQAKYELAHPNAGKSGTTILKCTGGAELRVVVLSSGNGGAGSTINFSWRPR